MASIPASRPCPACGRGNPIRVHASCFPPEYADYTGEWLFLCAACDRYFTPGQTQLSAFAGEGWPGS
jgi:hypothetical protein